MHFFLRGRGGLKKMAVAPPATPGGNGQKNSLNLVVPYENTVLHMKENCYTYQLFDCWCGVSFASNTIQYDWTYSIVVSFLEGQMYINSLGTGSFYYTYCTASNRVYLILEVQKGDSIREGFNWGVGGE